MDLSSPIHTNIVLVGGGHAHLAVIKNFGMRPEPGVRLTVISKEVFTAYSGMMPGLVAGHYDFIDAHIDLGPLCNFAKARLFHDEVINIDLERKFVICRNRPNVKFDLLSIDCGAIASQTSVFDAGQVIPVKPISEFNNQWENAKRTFQDLSSPPIISIVGGGPAGIELAMSIKHRLSIDEVENQFPHTPASIKILTSGPEILSSYPRNTQKTCRKILASAGIEVLTNWRVTKVKNKQLENDAGERITVDEIIWATGSEAPGWLKTSGLPTSERGFIQINHHLRVTGTETVFAAGDIADMEFSPRPKSGVFAVRQGRVLAQNIRRLCRGRKLIRFQPQRSVLSLITMGDKYVVGNKGPLTLSGKWLWYLKTYIDESFVKKFTVFPEMKNDVIVESKGEGWQQFDLMRCGGCGSKINSQVLHNALNNLGIPEAPEVIIGLSSPDDAAIIELPKHTVMVQTVDGFRTFIDDPYILGQVTACHALSDIYAMGAVAQTALALATVPLAAVHLMQEELTQMMTGALSVLTKDGVTLVGGHSSEGPEASLGFAINGYCDKEKIIRKQGAKESDVLILSKPIGTGVILAAQMQGKARSDFLHTALNIMVQSNQQASEIFLRNDVNAMTDVTGFGIAGHLLEMIEKSSLQATLRSKQIPILPGAKHLFEQGLSSSLQSDNFLATEKIFTRDRSHKSIQLNLLVDPQTSGGLLAAVPSNKAEQCLNDLLKSGYTASMIGEFSVCTGSFPIILD